MNIPKIRLNKKAQIRLIETVAILIVFFILLSAGIYFFFTYQRSSIIQESETIIQTDIVKKTMSLLSLPEISCSLAQADVTKGCIDYYKASKMKNIVDNNPDYYFDILQFSTLRLKIIYPESGVPQKEILLYNRTKSNYTQKTSVPLPVSVFQPIKLGGDLKAPYVYGILHLDIYN